MAKAPAYGAGDSRFESWRVQNLFAYRRKTADIKYFKLTKVVVVADDFIPRPWYNIRHIKGDRLLLVC